MRKRNTQVYAVVRIDNYPTDELENNITIKEIVWSLEEAEAEVARLNELNAPKVVDTFGSQLGSSRRMQNLKAESSELSYGDMFNRLGHHARQRVLLEWFLSE